MFDLFGGATTEQVDDVSKHFTIQFLGLVNLLITKGVITQEELRKSVSIATGPIDQLWQERKDELRAEFLRENSGAAKLLNLLGGSIEDQE